MNVWFYCEIVFLLWTFFFFRMHWHIHAAVRQTAAGCDRARWHALSLARRWVRWREYRQGGQVVGMRCVSASIMPGFTLVWRLGLTLEEGYGSASRYKQSPLQGVFLQHITRHS